MGGGRRPTVHLGLDGEPSASARIRDAAGNVVARYSAKVDGEFLERFLADVSRVTPPRPQRRTPAESVAVPLRPPPPAEAPLPEPAPAPR